jgi:hypothetical protein
MKIVLGIINAVRAGRDAVEQAWNNLTPIQAFELVISLAFMGGMIGLAGTIWHAAGKDTSRK